ncbi:DUF1000-domain-containing protein [Cantharellus anzutake]|uniref:DUF1000-domain-containing protein n=1 Tax=Cantharellus anzutake TaxID=1750568 RepID=UPI00190452DB|nr:DUF1000-domain-containing protein [Cantharellus anzutake]KAF8340749.1 DUF1000-domain-containing protein [Cantharellus anzutake]
MSHHNHHNNEGCHSHDDNHDDNEFPEASGNLYSKIDLPNVALLNSEHPATGAIKPWNERMSKTYIESDADDQLIIRVPFTGSVKLRSILLRAGPEDQTPSRILLFVNADQLDFNDASQITPTQEFEVAQSAEIGEYAVKQAKFPNVRSLTIFIPSSQGAEETRVLYLGFTGEFKELKEQPIITVYETQANLADHEKIQGTNGVPTRPGM